MVEAVLMSGVHQKVHIDGITNGGGSGSSGNTKTKKEKSSKGANSKA